jgi:hypothetical protein
MMSGLPSADRTDWGEHAREALLKAARQFERLGAAFDLERSTLALAALAVKRHVEPVDGSSSRD